MDADASISAATGGERTFDKHGRPDLTRSSSVLVSSNHRTGFLRPVAVEVLFPILIFFGTHNLRKGTVLYFGYFLGFYEFFNFLRTFCPLGMFHRKLCNFRNNALSTNIK